jgi:hypothetical protein
MNNAQIKDANNMAITLAQNMLPDVYVLGGILYSCVLKMEAYWCPDVGVVRESNP